MTHRSTPDNDLVVNGPATVNIAEGDIIAPGVLASALEEFKERGFEGCKLSPHAWRKNAEFLGTTSSAGGSFDMYFMKRTLGRYFLIFESSDSGDSFWYRQDMTSVMTPQVPLKLAETKAQERGLIPLGEQPE